MCHSFTTSQHSLWLITTRASAPAMAVTGQVYETLCHQFSAQSKEGRAPFTCKPVFMADYQIASHKSSLHFTDPAALPLFATSTKTCGLPNFFLFFFTYMNESRPMASATSINLGRKCFIHNQFPPRESFIVYWIPLQTITSYTQRLIASLNYWLV